VFEDATSTDTLLDSLRAELGVTATMLSLPLDTHHQILAHSGGALPAEYSSRLPLSHSICRHVGEMRFPLVVDDAYNHPLLHDAPAVNELGVAAYLGVPVETDPSEPVHVLCAYHNRQWHWSEQALELVFDAARAVRRLL
jgi:GAF domain-containing protein